MLARSVRSRGARGQRRAVQRRGYSDNKQVQHEKPSAKVAPNIHANNLYMDPKFPQTVQGIANQKGSAWGSLVTSIGKAVLPTPKEGPKDLFNYTPNITEAEEALYADYHKLQAQQRAPVIELANLRAEAKNVERAELIKSLATKLNKPAEQVTEIEIAGELLARREAFVKSIDLENTVLFSARYRLQILQKEAEAIKKLNPSAEALALLEKEIKTVEEQAANEMLVPVELEPDVFAHVKSNLFPSFNGVSATHYLALLGGSTKAQRPDEKELFFDDSTQWNVNDPYFLLSAAQKQAAVAAVNQLLAADQPSAAEIIADDNKAQERIQQRANSLASQAHDHDYKPITPIGKWLLSIVGNATARRKSAERKQAETAMTTALNSPSRKAFVIDVDKLRSLLVQQQSSLSLNDLQVAYALQWATETKAENAINTRSVLGNLLHREAKSGDVYPELRLAGLVPSSHFLLDHNSSLHIAGTFNDLPADATKEKLSKVSFTTRPFTAPTAYRPPDSDFTEHPFFKRAFQTALVNFPEHEKGDNQHPNNPRELVIDMKVWKLFNYIFPNLKTPESRLAFMEHYDISPGERTLEWTQSWPPPEHTFVETPIIKEAEEPSEDGKSLPVPWPKYTGPTITNNTASLTVEEDHHHHAEVVYVSDLKPSAKLAGSQLQIPK